MSINFNTGYPGSVLGTSISAGYIGESLQTGNDPGTVALVNSATTQINSVALSGTGIWLVTAMFNSITVSANTGGRVFSGIYTNSAGTLWNENKVSAADGETFTGRSNVLQAVVVVPVSPTLAQRTVQATIQVALGSAITGLAVASITAVRIA